MMGGASDDGWDILAVPWTSLFVGTGVAIHGAFWHNDFGTPKSHGCVNATPEDAKWIFRWTTPQVPYFPGDVTKQYLRRHTHRSRGTIILDRNRYGNNQPRSSIPSIGSRRIILIFIIIFLTLYLLIAFLAPIFMQMGYSETAK